MSTLDYFSGPKYDPMAYSSVEWCLEQFDPDAGKNGLVSEAFDKWARARDIIAERKRLAEEKAAQERAAKVQFAKERVQ